VLYHWTAKEEYAASILATAFADTPYRDPVGVHLCDHYDQHRGGRYGVLLLVALPAEQVTDDRLDPIQFPECRDYIIPSAVITAVGEVWRAYPANQGGGATAG